MRRNLETSLCALRRRADRQVTKASIAPCAERGLYLFNVPLRVRETKAMSDADPSMPAEPEDIRSSDAAEFAELRRAMVEDQIRARGVNDPRVLAAMNRVPREAFVPQRLRMAAYDDMPLPIGFGQTISQPFTVAFMCEALQLTGDEKVLEIGTGSGYAAAVLSLLRARSTRLSGLRRWRRKQQPGWHG